MARMNSLLRTILVLAALVLSAAAYAQQHRIHYTLLENPPRPLPKKLVVIPADVRVRELSAGGVLEKMPAWTEQASSNLTAALQAAAGQRKDFELVPLPEFTEEERAQLDQYLATYMVVGSAAHYLTLFRDPAWEHKRQRFDYTLGSGLEFLRQKTGADAAIMLVGDDVVSSAERKVAFVLAAAFGIGLPMGQSLVSVGVVDLGSGDILWMQHSTSISHDLKDPEGAKAMVAEILTVYPGLPATK
ncbi:MAG: hypothetical protein ACOZCP_13865 [Pseudomonadota bacterium]